MEVQRHEKVDIRFDCPQTVAVFETLLDCSDRRDEIGLIAILAIEKPQKSTHLFDSCANIRKHCQNPLLKILEFEGYKE
jgi:hypothetical protein